MNVLDIRPYQLMCIVCRIGEGASCDLASDRLDAILNVVRRDPALPLRLRCNVDAGYRFQNPGRAEDTTESELFNTKRDLEILKRLGLTPGATWPAIDLVRRLFAEIKSTRGICDYPGPPSPHWRSCRRAGSGFYEKGLALGFESVIPRRSEREMQEAKGESVRAIHEAEGLMIRPHHLMCMTCFYGREKVFEPIKEDNLYELIAVIQASPDIPVMLVKGPCMVCPPCPEYDPASRLCLGVYAMALRDERKDLEVLQRLGLNYGDALPARELFRRLYAAFETTVSVCSNGDGIASGPTWTICGGPGGNPAYVKGRAAGLGISGVTGG
ncbi:MAG: hypothetical protein V2A58_07060 [Planctomycetota bacterium]